MKEYFVYILQFNDGSYYTGITNNIEKRMWQYRHNRFLDSYVSQKGPFELVRVETYEYVLDAIGREKQIKRWSRKKKDALATGNWQLLPRLSENTCIKRIRSMRKMTMSSLDKLGMTQ